MREDRNMNKKGIAAAYTLDAGSNVHVICTEASHEKVEDNLQDIPGVIEVLDSPSGNGAGLIQPTSTN